MTNRIDAIYQVQTSETDVTLVLKPDGVGGVAFGTGESGATVRFAAGVPSGAPTGTELPIAFDSTAVTGGVYYWTGAAWVKGGAI